ncbi:hypothetical protein DPV79_23575 [Burkholderia reimsis]|uniref:Uncharacterized protein n=1 Tax=Burkholderia reimsis TaxID=2234132 RepID=A0A365QR20_9BURK|nr:hypothetical protein DPV79_23575 [Burkholderia reimsis]
MTFIAHVGIRNFYANIVMEIFHRATTIHPAHTEGERKTRIYSVVCIGRKDRGDRVCQLTDQFGALYVRIGRNQFGRGFGEIQQSLKDFHCIRLPLTTHEC